MYGYVQGSPYPALISTIRDRVTTHATACASVARPYRGSTRLHPRRGTLRSPHIAPTHTPGTHQCRTLAPIYIKALGGPQVACKIVCKIGLDIGALAYAGIPVWWTAWEWITKDVPAAYREHYLSKVLPRLRRESGGKAVREGTKGGGGIKLSTIIAVCRVMMEAADFRTGRGMRLTNKSIAERSGFSVRTVSRVKTFLLECGLATEVLRGRQRTRDEQIAAWKVGDQSRGWASVWALHPPRPVDNFEGKPAGQRSMATHPRRGIFSNSSSLKSVVTTPERVKERAASRRRDTKRVLVSAPDPAGALLASRWRSAERTPAWVRRHTQAGWASVLAKPAENGWTADDLNAVIRAFETTRRTTAEPTQPLAFMRWLLSAEDLDFPPHVLDAIEREQAAAERAARQAAAAARHEEAQRRREIGRAAVGGAGHRAALAAVPQVATSLRAHRLTSSQRPQRDW